MHVAAKAALVAGVVAAGPIGWAVLAAPLAVMLAGTAPAAAEDAPVMTPFDETAFAARWQGAPDGVRAIARMIAQGGTPPPDALAALGPDRLSQGHPAPTLDFTVDGRPVAFQATLLQEAVMAANLPAATALLAAGADPDVNHGEALFAAVTTRSPGAAALAAFPDYDATLAIVEALLAAGANPNLRRNGVAIDTLLGTALGHWNLGAMLALLQAGADPWVRVPHSASVFRESVMEELAFGSAATTAAEVLFRLARSGHLPAGDPAQVDRVFASLAAVADEFASGTGPQARHIAWRLDMVLRVLGPALGRAGEAERIRAGLTRFDPGADGGWFLAEGEVRSRRDEPLALPDKGRFVWGP